MNKFYPLSVAVLTILTMVVGCDESENGPVTPVLATNLIANGSFETEGSPTLDGWISIGGKPVSFSTEAPGNGGSYSAQLEGDHIAPAMLRYPIALTSGTHRYELSFWAKADPISFPNSGGSILLHEKGLWPPYQWLYVGDTVWTYFSVVDTLTGPTADTVFVHLEGGYTGSLLVDLCSFERLD